MKNGKLEGILDALKQEDCVIFIGSGISMWAGLPSWTGLLNELAVFIEECGGDSVLVRREINGGDLLQAASYGFDKLSKDQIEKFMKQACRYEQAEPHEIHRKILELGPKCFITTNYDKLIEMGITKWLNQKSIKMVTNRHLVEMGGIVHARALNFIFKPHGDIEDVESIILTREQYRSLLINGERHMALEVLKTLMVSRPVVYMGYGLKDPDFLYIRDILANIYQGNQRVHYAIMADIVADEIDYWRRNYGIHLIGYQTQDMPDGARSHQALYALLEHLNSELHKNDTYKQKIAIFEMIPVLMRYAARLMRYPKAASEFTIYVHRENDFYSYKQSGCLVDEFLVKCRKNVVLIGLPGAGKSYAMHKAASILAENLAKKCLEKDVLFQELIIPIYIDLKLYDGNLEEMIEKEFSKALSFEVLGNTCRCIVFLDSFNEMPKEYWHNGSYKSDFDQVFEKYKNLTIIIGSRTEYGLKEFKFLHFYLNEIDRETIEQELIKGGQNKEINDLIYDILSKPFYFQYIISGKINIKNITQPRHFYREFFDELQNDCNLHFYKKMDFEKLLAPVAYKALDIGIEAFPAEFIYEELSRQNFTDIKEMDEIINWLIYKGIVIPQINEKITFVHQSVTEYLAATQLLESYLNDKGIVNNKLKSYRWDQVMLFMVNLLPEELMDEFISQLFQVDFKLVLDSVKYMESHREKIVDVILNEIIENREVRQEYIHDIDRSLRNDLPITYMHEKKIRKLMEFGYEFGVNIGDSAIECLHRLLGSKIKNELIQRLFEVALSDDSHKETGFLILKKIIEEKDLDILISLIDKVQEKAIGNNISVHIAGFTSEMGIILEQFDVSSIKKSLIADYELSELPMVRREVLYHYLFGKYTAESLELATDLFMEGYISITIPMYFIACFSKKPLPWDFFESKHVDRLIYYMDEDIWTLKFLKELLKHRKDLSIYVERRAEQYHGIVKAAILFCITDTNQEIVFDELEALLGTPEEEISDLTYKLIHDMELVWTNKEKLLIKLLMTKDLKLAHALIDVGGAPPEIKGITVLEIRNIDWWMNWIEEIESMNFFFKKDWFLLVLTGLITKYASPETKAMYILKFNDKRYRYRKTLLKYIIPQLRTSINDYNKNSIRYILNDLKKTPYYQGNEPHFLSYAADEKFIIERILPLLNSSNKVLKNNLISIVKVAGQKHGKRYIINEFY